MQACGCEPSLSYRGDHSRPFPFHTARRAVVVVRVNRTKKAIKREKR